MKRYALIHAIFAVITIASQSCQNKINKIQGIFIVNKESLTKLTAAADEGNAFTNALLSKMVENAVFELEIKNDSIAGLIFFGGESNVVKNKLEVRHDSIFFYNKGNVRYLIPNKNGILLKGSSSDFEIQLMKSPQTELSSETQLAIEAAIKQERELEEFEKSLGTWQKGSFVDEFGDKTGNGYPYTIVRGSHENSAVIGSDVYVKAMIEDNGLYFQIFNSSMTMKESFPDNEFGYAKIKLSNGSVLNQKIFFLKNTISESYVDETRSIYHNLIGQDEEIKVIIDLSTASKYYSDKYQFTLKKGNLGEIINDVD